MKSPLESTLGLLVVDFKAVHIVASTNWGDHMKDKQAEQQISPQTVWQKFRPENF